MSRLNARLFPTVKNPSWVKNPIDRFVLAKLEEQGLSPAPEAAPATLLRRLSLDLTGLPPSLEALAAPFDFQREAERLISSPHFGERWGREWLDAARYSDSAGYEKDLPRKHHFYRDWVVNALNANLPYDQFVIKQIAGDLLPGATQDDRIATGFLRNSMTNEEGGAKPEQFRIEGVFDRIDAIGKSMLGLTAQCAQCHTHKYDPLTHDEYFGIFAYLNGISETSIPAFTPDERKLTASIDGQIPPSRKISAPATPAGRRISQNGSRTCSPSRAPSGRPSNSISSAIPARNTCHSPTSPLINMGYAATKSG